jgi:hypothetical protein
LNSLLKVEQVEGVLEELEHAFFDIPFENSDFQNKAFVVAAQQTPARAYRAIGLRMHAKIRAVKEFQYQRALNQIDIEEKQAKIADEATSEFDRRRLRIEIAKIQEGESWGQKLLNDALRELDCLYAEFKKLPRYTRAQFEAEEPAHFKASLTRQLSHNGAQASLASMTHDLAHWDRIIEQSVALLEIKD